MNNKLIQMRNISVANDLLKIGLAVIELKAIAAIIPETILEDDNPTQKYKVFIRYKSKNYETLYMNGSALEYMCEIWERYKENEIRKRFDNDQVIKSNRKNKIIGMIKYYLQLILITATLIAVLTTKSYGDDKFPYTAVYDVNKDVCVNIDEYKNVFSYNEVKNSKLVAEFPQRPGELVFVNNKDEMYVFTDTLPHCLTYRTHFLEDVDKQMKEEESKYKYIDLEDEIKGAKK